MDVLMPNYEYELKNPKETVKAMADAVSRGVSENTRKGKDAHGRRLPKPKDGGKPLYRSGTFFHSIGPVLSKTRRSRKPTKRKQKPPMFHVFATGARPLDENVKAKKKRARIRSKEMKAAAVLGEAFGVMATGRDLNPTFKRKRRGAGMSVSRIRVRAADTNAALSGILSVAPKDKRSKNGKRGIYRVFEASEQYRKIAFRTGRVTQRSELVEGKAKIRAIGTGASK